MGIFSGLGDTEIYEKGYYLTPGGVYDLEVQQMLVKETRKSGLAFIVEFKVLSVEGSDQVLEKHPVGSRATWLQKLADKDVAFPAIKECFVALLDVDMRDPEAKEEFNSQIEDLLDEATDPDVKPEDHPLRGHKVTVETYSKLTKNKGLDFTVHSWRVYDK